MDTSESVRVTVSQRFIGERGGLYSSVAPIAILGYLPPMRWWFRPRSRCFRVVLGMALLAWTAFAFDAFAHPLMMGAAPAAHASATAAGMSAPSEGMPAMAMPHTSHATVPVQPIGNGHGCCQNAHCYCASFCSGIAGAPGMTATVAPPQGQTFMAVGDELVPTPFTLFLRPPIA
jgi:hypothetical protein